MLAWISSWGLRHQQRPASEQSIDQLKLGPDSDCYVLGGGAKKPPPPFTQTQDRRLRFLASEGGGSKREKAEKLDILHFATAVHLGASRFLTFDARQRALAIHAGLEIPA